MSRICNILGLAVIGIALLAGAAAATDAEVGGCVIPSDYFSLTKTSLAPDIDLGIMQAGTVTPAGGSLGVVAGDVYDLTVTSNPADGKLTSGGNALANELQAKANDSVLADVSGAGLLLVDGGVANTGCDKQTVTIGYSQVIDGSDLELADAGDYAIALTYTIADGSS